jgi:hypothetical protein
MQERLLAAQRKRHMRLADVQARAAIRSHRAVACSASKGSPQAELLAARVQAAEQKRLATWEQEEARLAAQQELILKRLVSWAGRIVDKHEGVGRIVYKHEGVQYRLQVLGMPTLPSSLVQAVGLCIQHEVEFSDYCKSATELVN